MKATLTRITILLILFIFNIFGYAQDTLVIIHSNDTHSQIDPFLSKTEGEVGGVIRRYNFINQIRSKYANVLVLDPGDFSQGTPFYNFFSGAAEISLMNMMGYDVVGLGNHEFDKGSASLAKQLKRANFQVVCANYKFKNRKLSRIIKPYTVLTINNQRIGIFGLTTNLRGLVSPTTEKELEYLDPIETAKKMVQILMEMEHCDMIICLSHLGFDQVREEDVSDKILIDQVNGIDIVIGGHSHDYLASPLELNNTIIVQTGAKGAYIGKIVITQNK